MPGPILVGYDGSEAAKLALAFATELARERSATVVLCNVVPSSPQHMALSPLLYPSPEATRLVAVQSFRAAAGKRLEEVAAEARQGGVEVEAVVRTGNAADELLAAAREAGAEHVVLGFMSYEHALPAGIGSVAERVLRLADRTVTIVRPAPPSPAKPKGKKAR